MTRALARRLPIAGTEVAAGSKVMLCLGAANRDTVRYLGASRLLVDRTDIATLPFGWARGMRQPYR
ncbi:hypothetical protein [Streptomyces sp. NPDC050538]|uniref:hypothetical protein n=1 Tax=Streptomyces sp. NPDC050538 TaxID=3365627 RepID=UPI0037957DAE